MTAEEHSGAAKYIQKLVDDLKQAQRRIKELEDEISTTKAKRTELEQIVIPDYMAEHDLKGITLLSGDTVTVKPFYYARLPENPNQFYDWLRQNGHGAIVKDKFEVFPADAEAGLMLQQFLDDTELISCTYDRSRSIHWKTLEAWFKEQCENHNNLPLNLFTNMVGRKATVK